MKLTEFYKQVLENVRFSVDKEDYIYIMSNDQKELLTYNGKVMVLPSKEHLDTLFVKNEEGQYVVNKLLFNPLNEDVIKGDSESIKKLKQVVELNLTHVIFAIGELLLTLASNVKLQKKISTDLEMFLATLTKAISQGQRGGVVDEKSVENWSNVYSNIAKNYENGFTVYLKKRGTIDGKTYTRVATLSSNLLDDLDNLIENTKELTTFKLNGVTIRKKDVVVFKEVFKYILKDLTTVNTITVGSNDIEAPTFISLFKLYIKVAKRNNELLTQLKFVNNEVFDSYFINNLLEEKDLENISRFKTELLDIPSDIDLSRNITNKNTSVTQPSPYPNTPVPVTPSAEVDPLRLSLYGKSGSPQPMYQQQQYYPQIQQPQFTGLNNVPQYQPQPQFAGLNTTPSIQQPQFITLNNQPTLQQPGSYYISLR